MCLEAHCRSGAGSWASCLDVKMAGLSALYGYLNVLRGPLVVTGAVLNHVERINDLFVE